MARVVLKEVQAWVEPSKVSLTALDSELLTQLEEEVLIQLTSQYNVVPWITPETTPKIVRVIIAKMYASFHIDRAYSENQDGGNDYAARLMANANMLLTGLVGGSFEPPDVVPTNPSTPSFFPTDASSAQLPTEANPEFGGPYFSLGRVF